MIQIDIPGNKKITIEHLVMDYNGTLAVDGVLIEAVKPLIIELSSKLNLHVITADTFGLASIQLTTLPVKLVILPSDKQQEEKLKYIEQLGKDTCAVIGNGVNDALMLKHAAIGIALLQEEGLALEALMASDIIMKNAMDALNLFLHPKRMVATLRK
jgi:P-type E1-E2 ATPase